jgi:hypothetical protein
MVKFGTIFLGNGELNSLQTLSYFGLSRILTGGYESKTQEGGAGCRMSRFSTTCRANVRCWDLIADFYGQPLIFWAICFDLSHKCRKIRYAKNRFACTGTARDMEGLNFGPDDDCTLVHLLDLNCTLVHFFVLWPTFQNSSSRLSKTF